MAELESAEEFARRVAMLWNETSVDRPAARLIQADRAAIALVAKHELLEEMRLGMNEHMKGKGLYVDPGEALAVAYDAAVAKYTAAEPAVETREG